jgi:hypothetical protein
VIRQLYRQHIEALEMIGAGGAVGWMTWREEEGLLILLADVVE